MDNISPVLLAACGFLVVCLGLVVVGALLMYRLLRVNIFSMAMGIFMRPSADEPVSAPIVSRKQEDHDLRAKAQALDFDAAVARYRNDPDTPAAQTETGFQSQKVDDFEGFKPADHIPDNDSTSRRRRRDRNEDEVFGGYLDADGDGDVDF